MRFIGRFLCYLGFHKWIKLPDDYDVEADWNCWVGIDFDNYNPQKLYKCKRCGEVETR